MTEPVAIIVAALSGSLVTWWAQVVHSRVRGARYENAARVEIGRAKETVHEKMRWLSRDVPRSLQRGDKLMVESGDGKLLYLGEDERFFVSLLFWDTYSGAIVQALSHQAYQRLALEVYRLRRFEQKFREMKLAFKTGSGDPKVMALACYRDLQEIERELLS